MTPKTFWEKTNTFVSNVGFVVAIIAVIISAISFYFDTKTVISAQIKNVVVQPIDTNKTNIMFQIVLKNTGAFDAEKIDIKINQLSLAKAESLLNWGSIYSARDLAINRKDEIEIFYFIGLGGPEATYIFNALQKNSRVSFPLILQTTYSTLSTKHWFTKRKFSIRSIFEINSLAMSDSKGSPVIISHVFRKNTDDPEITDDQNNLGGNMNTQSIILGLSVTVLAGHLFIWLLIDKWLRRKNKRTSKWSYAWLLGMVERTLYFIALLMGTPQWIPFWITAKIAITWHPQLINKEGGSFEKDSYNIFLIGNAFCVLFAFLGVWMALGFHLPPVKI